MATTKGNFSITNPLKIEMSMVHVMTVEDWKKVANELEPDDGRKLDHWHPAEVLRRSIVEMIEAANTQFHFYETAPIKENNDGQ